MGYHWIDHTQGSTLQFNYKGVGAIQKSGGAYRWTLTWNKHLHEGTTQHPGRQKVWMSRWVAARTRMPLADVLRSRQD